MKFYYYTTNYTNDSAREPCGVHGTCVSYEVCDCDEFWSGVDTCNITTCNGYYSNETGVVCSNHGECIDYEHCSCSEFYYGDSCNVTTCSGTFSNVTNEVCHGGRGSCYPWNECNCYDLYFGEDCEVTKCQGVYSNVTEDVCSGYGRHDYDKCACNESYFGVDCNVTTCGSGDIYSNTSEVCTNGRGVCWPHDVCECLDDYYGVECEVTICNGAYSNESASDVCSGHGQCLEFEECTCEREDGFTGDDCQESLSGFPDSCSQFATGQLRIWYSVPWDLIGMDIENCDTSELIANHDELFGVGVNPECVWRVEFEIDDTGRRELSGDEVTEGFVVTMDTSHPVYITRNEYTVMINSLTSSSLEPLHFDLTGYAYVEPSEDDDDDDEGNNYDDSAGGVIGGIVGGFEGVGGVWIVLPVVLFDLPRCVGSGWSCGSCGSWRRWVRGYWKDPGGVGVEEDHGRIE